MIAIFCAVTIAIHFNSDNLFVLIEESGIYREEVIVRKIDGNDLTLRKWTIDELSDGTMVSLDQSLMLINTDYTLPESFVPQIAEYKDTDVFMNSCMLEAYASLSAAVTENFGKKLYVSDDFRTAAEQEQLYMDMPDTATMPGASEHQSGLALDVYVAKYAGDAFIKSPAGRFVNSHCHEYGFIIRYPSYGEDETDIRFEPWHIRYVGQPHAKIIYNNRLTLEEYVLSLEIGQWYEVDGYIFCRQSVADGELTIPESFATCTVSPDNTGCYIVTVEK